MDFHSLVASNLPQARRPTIMDARAEERYYRAHDAGPRPWLGPLVSLATTVGLILLAISVARA